MEDRISWWKQELREKGFDVCHAFCPQWYNHWVDTTRTVTSRADQPASLRVRLDENASHAFLIGNTKHLWPIFKKWLLDNNYNSLDLDEDTTDQLVLENPLDSYCEQAITDSCRRLRETAAITDETTGKLAKGLIQGYKCHWSCEMEPEKLVAMQQVAHVSGLAYYDDQNTYLSIHPVYGAWLSYRAVVLLYSKESPGDTERRSSVLPRPATLANPMKPEEQAAAKQALENAIAAATRTKRDRSQALKDSWASTGVSAWIALRGCVGVGSESRFDEDQLLYHYTKDQRYLRA